MRLSQLGEFGLIEAIARTTPKGSGVRIGIGDDAAWVSHPRQSSLITSDLLIEGIHFDLRWTTMFDLGYKTLAVNLSDIAAMGGISAYLMLSLGIPSHFDSKKIAEFYRGIHSLAARSGVTLIGGDTNIAPLFLACACVIGHPSKHPLTRSGAKTGDDIYVTGTLGDAALALQILQSKSKRAHGKTIGQLMQRHHRPTARLTAGSILAEKRVASAMIDISDGLIQDLGHICKASGVGAEISADDIPLSSAYRAVAGKDDLRYALSGGEDYELLFCAPHSHRDDIEKLQRRAKVSITRIGRCVASRAGISVIAASGKPMALDAPGHDHFKKSANNARRRRSA